MTDVVPDSTAQVKGQTLRVVTRGKAETFIVVADAKGAQAKIAHLIQKRTDQELITSLAVIEQFPTEVAAVTAYSMIPAEERALPQVQSSPVQKMSA